MFKKDLRVIHLFFVLAFIVFAEYSVGQNLKGKILDQKTQEPLVGATLVLKSANNTFSTSSGFDGR